MGRSAGDEGKLFDVRVPVYQEVGRWRVREEAQLSSVKRLLCKWREEFCEVCSESFLGVGGNGAGRVRRCRDFEALASC